MLDESWLDRSMRFGFFCFLIVLAFCCIIGVVFIIEDYKEEIKRREENEKLEREWWKK